jgi:hypothetical protein
MCYVWNTAWLHCTLYQNHRLMHVSIYKISPHYTAKELTRSCSIRANSLSWASMAIILSWSNISNCWNPSCSCRRRANSCEATSTCVIYRLHNSVHTNHNGSHNELDTVDECHSSHEFQLRRRLGQHPLTGAVQFQSTKILLYNKS